MLQSLNCSCVVGVVDPYGLWYIRLAVQAPPGPHGNAANFCLGGATETSCCTASSFTIQGRVLSVVESSGGYLTTTQSSFWFHCHCLTTKIRFI